MSNQPIQPTPEVPQTTSVEGLDGTICCASLVLCADQETMDRAIRRLKESPYTRPWEIVAEGMLKRIGGKPGETYVPGYSTTPQGLKWIKQNAIGMAAGADGWFAARYVWGYFARWWDCVDEMLDMEACKGSIPGVLAERWWYCDLYETECECIAETQAEAEAIFRQRYPWIEVFHVTLRGEYKPPSKKKARRKSRRANAPALAQPDDHNKQSNS